MNASAGGTSRRECCAGVFSVLTPPGRGGIAVVRCFGPAVPEALAAAFRPARHRPGEAGRTEDLPAVGRLAYGHFSDADGQVLDEIILHRAAAEAFEINCHGGPAAVEAVCRRLAALGLERVGSDRLLELAGASPIERDARRLLQSARTPLAARILLDQLNGALGQALAAVAADLQAGLRPGGAGRKDDARRGIETLLARWRTCGRFLAPGAPGRIAVAGRPNTGKSTLVNRFVGTERVITSAAPGTTRDTVETEAAIEGVPLLLVDTAGLGEAQAAVEREGVARARRQMAEAPLVVYLLNAAEGVQPEDAAALAALGPRALAVWNKSDLACHGVVPPGRSRAPEAEKGTGSFSGRREKVPVPFSALRVSALHGDGMDALGRAILARLGWQTPPAGDAVPFTPAQAAALESACAALARGDAAEARKNLELLLKAPAGCARCPATESAETPRP